MPSDGVKPKPTRMPVIRAKQPGPCPSCKGGWRTGTLITLLNEQWVHNKCATGERALPKWTRHDTLEARAYKAALARGETGLSRQKKAWAPGGSPGTGHLSGAKPSYGRKAAPASGARRST